MGTEAQRHDASLHAARKEDDAVLEDGSADGEWKGSSLLADPRVNSKVVVRRV
jgi:hypothetical protein